MGSWVWYSVTPHCQSNQCVSCPPLRQVRKPHARSYYTGNVMWNLKNYNSTRKTMKTKISAAPVDREKMKECPLDEYAQEGKNPARFHKCISNLHISPTKKVAEGVDDYVDRRSVKVPRPLECSVISFQGNQVCGDLLTAYILQNARKSCIWLTLLSL